MKNAQNTFRRALLDATLADYDDVSADQSVIFSSAFTRKTKRLLRKNYADKQIARKFPVKRIILIAAILSLFVISVVAEPVTSEEDWIILVDENGNSIDRIKLSIPYENSSKAPENLEKLYMPTYLPEGFTLESKNINETRIRYQWQDVNNDYIIFSQSVLQGEHLIPLLTSDYVCEVITINSMDVLRIVSYDVIYVWTDGMYLYRFDFYANCRLPNEDEQIRVLQSVNEVFID